MQSTRIFSIEARDETKKWPLWSQNMVNGKSNLCKRLGKFIFCIFVTNISSTAWYFQNINLSLCVSSQTGVHSHSANEFGVCHKTKRPFKRFNGLVSGQHKSERSLPIGNPCDAELSSLMRCMKEHDYDNIPCLGKRLLPSPTQKLWTERTQSRRVNMLNFRPSTDLFIMYENGAWRLQSKTRRVSTGRKDGRNVFSKHY